MKMVAHAADADHFGKIDFAEAFDYIEKIVFFHIPERKAVQRGSGHHMIDRMFPCDQHARYPCHISPFIQFVVLILLLAEGTFDQPKPC